MAKIPVAANRTLAVIYVCLDRQKEAEAVITKLLEKEPDFTLTKVREKMQHRYTDQTQLERWINDLRTAGLPE